MRRNVYALLIGVGLLLISFVIGYDLGMKQRNRAWRRVVENPVQYESAMQLTPHDTIPDDQ